jgi:hypothetical protein
MAKTQRDMGENAGKNPESEVTHEEIQARAYALYLARGGEDGHDVEDWLEAERSLQSERSVA